MAKIYQNRPPTVRQSEDEENKEEKGEDQKVTNQEIYSIVGKTYNPLSSYQVRPKAVRFETQFKGEEIFLLLRRHMITNIGWFLLTAILIFAPSMILTIPFLDLVPNRFVVIFFLMWYMFVFAYFFESFLTWYFHVFIITDRRVVDVDFYNLAYKEISEAKIKNIVDVTLVMGGPIQTIFNFGRIQIQTAGQVPEIEFEHVPQPVMVMKLLKNLHLAKKQGKLKKTNHE